MRSGGLINGNGVLSDFAGCFGASVIPLAQSILVQTYSRAERGKAMAMFSVGVMVGPVLGPVVGGTITEHLDWRWVFYINLPMGALCLFLIFRNIHVNNRGESSVDWPLVLSMATGIGLLQMILSQGNEKDWFNSGLILFSSVICVFMLVFLLPVRW